MNEMVNSEMVETNPGTDSAPRSRSWYHFFGGLFGYQVSCGLSWYYGYNFTPTDSNHFYRWLFTVLVWMPIFVLLWALLAWMVTRVIKSEGTFKQHLIVAAFVMWASMGIGFVYEYASFALSPVVAAKNVLTVLGYLIAPLMIYVQLRQASCISRSRATMVTAALSLIFFAIVVPLQLVASRAYQSSPSFHKNLYNSRFLIVQPNPADTLDSRAAELKLAVERDLEAKLNRGSKR